MTENDWKEVQRILFILFGSLAGILALYYIFIHPWVKRRKALEKKESEWEVVKDPPKRQRSDPKIHWRCGCGGSLIEQSGFAKVFTTGRWDRVREYNDLVCTICGGVEKVLPVADENLHADYQRRKQNDEARAAKMGISVKELQAQRLRQKINKELKPLGRAKKAN